MIVCGTFRGEFFVNQFGEVMFEIDPNCKAAKAYPSPLPIAPYEQNLQVAQDFKGEKCYVVHTSKDDRLLVIPHVSVEYFKNLDPYNGFGYYHEYQRVKALFRDYLEEQLKNIKED